MIARPPIRDALCAPAWGEMLRQLSAYSWRIGYSQDAGRYWCMLLGGDVLPDAMCWGDTLAEAVIGTLGELSR